MGGMGVVPGGLEVRGRRVADDCAGAASFWAASF
jgi:hypothetical protein